MMGLLLTAPNTPSHHQHHHRQHFHGASAAAQPPSTRPPMVRIPLNPSAPTADRDASKCDKFTSLFQAPNIDLGVSLMFDMLFSVSVCLSLSLSVFVSVCLCLCLS